MPEPQIMDAIRDNGKESIAALIFSSTIYSQQHLHTAWRKKSNIWVNGRLKFKINSPFCRNMGFMNSIKL